MENQGKDEKNGKWILIVSLIMFFVLEWRYFQSSPFPYTFFDFWFLIYFVNSLSLVLTITFATLDQAGFWEPEITYQLSIFFFILSMAFFFVSQLQLILNVGY